jgi:hypothetical protein
VSLASLYILLLCSTVCQLPPTVCCWELLCCAQHVTHDQRHLLPVAPSSICRMRGLCYRCMWPAYSAPCTTLLLLHFCVVCLAVPGLTICCCCRLRSHMFKYMQAMALRQAARLALEQVPSTTRGLRPRPHPPSRRAPSL